MENFDNININELVEAVLNNERNSTLPADPKYVQCFVREEEEAYKILDSVCLGFTKSSFCNINLAVT